MKNQGWKAGLENTLLGLWYGKSKPGLVLGSTLGAFELLYRFLRLASQQSARSQLAKKPGKPPVLVIGNLIAGGAGKTPVVLAVCRHVQTRGKKAGIVSRGYGRSGKGTLVLDPSRPLPAASETGDEPVFLCMQTGCPVAVSSDRNEAVEQLLLAFPDLDLIVSDDGLQHHRMARQLEWVVFDERAQGNGRLLPAGPLREPLSRLATVDAVLSSNLPAELLAKALGIPAGNNWHEVHVQLAGFTHLQTGETIEPEEARNRWHESRVLAFTGIANPHKLFNAIGAAGISLEATQGLPDHFDYPASFCDQFDQPVLITSGKDAVKLDHTNPALWVANIQVELPPALTFSLEKCIGSTTD